jgi:hypothetical protein
VKVQHQGEEKPMDSKKLERVEKEQEREEAKEPRKKPYKKPKLTKFGGVEEHTANFS